jgi:cysteinyl-tRNA synthetase
MDDDFNTGGAVSDLFDISRAINRFIEQNNLEDAGQRTPERMATLDGAMSVLKELGAILGLFQKPPKKSAEGGDQEVVDGLMQLLIQLRAAARSKKDFATSDAIRDGLSAVGIALQDLKEGTTWEKT